MKEIRLAITLGLTILSLMFFFTNNVADAIYVLVWAGMIKPKGDA